MGDVFVDDTEGITRSPTASRRPSNKLVAFIDRLKPSRASSGGAAAVADGEEEGEEETSPRKSGPSRRKSTSSRLPSGKHTPSDAEGDYGHFLKAAELKDRLEKEKIREAEDELRLAKANRKSGKVTKAGVRSKPKTPDEVIEPRETLEAKKEVPGGFDDLQPPMRSPGHGKRHHAKEQDRIRTSPPSASKPSYFGICGVDISDDEGVEGEAADGARSPTLLHDGFATEANSPGSPSGTHDTPVLQAASSSSSLSSTASILDEELTQPPQKSASTRSLKSWRSTDSPGDQSLASGGANSKLSAPLLELEELELKSFLKNFNRHTREVRVPASLHFPRRRMPQWEDFRVPPDEAAVAAREGKRVTVLTHVDRGLQALARQEGQGAPPPREVAQPSPKKERKGFLGGGESQPVSSHPNSSQGPHVKWSPETGFVPRGLSTGLPDKDEEVRSVASRAAREGNEL